MVSICYQKRRWGSYSPHSLRAISHNNAYTANLSNSTDVASFTTVIDKNSRQRIIFYSKHHGVSNALNLHVAIGLGQLQLINTCH